jgi:RNA polymerase sigma-70 factor, ECF subfamily
MEGPERRRARSAAAALQGQRGVLTLERESSLRQRIAARDERALTELIELTTPWLLGVAQAMLQEGDDAEDVVMETFRMVWTSVLPSDDVEQGLMPLLLRITRQRSIDRLRSRRRTLRLASAVGLSEMVHASVLPVEPNEAAQPGWHVHAQVHCALAALPDDQRTAVRLVYFEGLAQSEIAVALGVPLGTVKTRLRLAFVKLRTALAPVKDWVT